MNCDHKKGGAPVNHYWVCAHCYKRLSERPYTLVSVGVSEGDIPPQQKMVYAPIPSVNGCTFEEFLRAIAQRIAARSDMPFIDALDYAVDVAKGTDVPYGHPDYEWSRDDAYDLADEDMEYWENGNDASN